tara:strand:+ start:2209 stop:4062 length:1854 start_codon:yes stop_codon:yes gene_type:complete
MSANTKLLPHIQVLRGFSVILVFLYHLKINFFSKGYIGVDIFFVISGFVITNMLIKEFEITKKINFLSFYIKRFKRIFPLLIFVTTTTFVLYKFFGPPDLSLRKDFIYSLLGVSNILFMFKEIDYFDNVFDNPYAHTWSLGVEEQFYLIFPIFLFFILKYLNFKNIAKFFYLLIFISLFTIFFFNINISTIFYLPFLRFWEFFFGCFIPFIKLKKNNLLSLIFLIIALVIIFLPIHINQNGTIYIIHNILVVLCVSNFLIYYQQNKIYELIFNNKFLVILGNQSYSIYLWHLPIIYFVSIYFNNKTFLILTLILTFSFSFLTYHFVENYFRYRKWDKKFIFKPLGILVSLVIIFIFSNKLFSTSEIRSFVKKNNYLEKNFNWIDRTTFKKMKINDFPVYPNCQKNIREQLYKNEINLKCLKENKSKDLFYLVGNSYIAQHVPMFNQEKKFDFYYEHYDDNLNSNFNKLSVFSKKYNKVYLVKSINNNNEFKKFIETVKNNYNQKINFLAIGPIPNFRNKYLNPLTCLIQKLECEINKIEDLNERNLQNIKDQMILLMQTNTNLYFFDSYDALCPLLKCSVYNNNEDLLMLRDDKHLSYEGSLSISKKFKKFVMEELE